MPKCYTCDTELTHKVLNTDGKTFSPYWSCGHCDMWQQNPLQPKIYEGDHEKTADGQFAGHLMGDQEKAANQGICDSLFTEYLNSEPCTALDVGSKYAYLSKCLKDKGCNAWGMDAIECTDAYSKELNVPMLTADFEKMSAKEILKHTGVEKFKLITLVHMVEHFYDPLKALYKLRQIIDDDGILYIRMPDHSVSGYERDLTPGHYTIHPYYHSLSSILALLVKGENLFTVIKVSRCEGYGQNDIILKPIKRKPTLYCGIITKNEERDLPKCIKSILPVVDKIVVVDTGSTDNTKQATIDAVAEKVPLDYFTYTGASKQDENGEWKLWDFGKARNEYVRVIEADLDADYLIWMDSDDQLMTPDHLKRALYCDFIDAFGMQIETGGQRWIHCRMWKTKRGVNFAGKIHEYPVLKDMNYVDLADSVIQHDPEPGLVGEGANPRNLRILEAEFEEDPESTRLAFYLGNTHKDASRFEEAIPYYTKRIELGEAFRDEWLFTYLYKGRCERAAGHLDVAKKTLLEGISHASNWSEFWMELSYMSYNKTNWEEAIGFALIACSNEIPPTQLWREKDKYADQPLRMISWSYEELGNFQEALEYAKKANAIIPANDAEWSERIKRLEGRVGAIITGKSKTKRIAVNRPGAIGDIIMTLSLIPELQKKWPEHAIDYFCSSQLGAHLKELMSMAGVAEVIDCTQINEHSHKYDKIFNMIGYPLHENYPNGPMRQHLIQYFAEELGLEPKIWALAVGTPQMNLPDLPKQYATLQVTTGWSIYKTLELSKWEEVVKRCPDITFIQIGSAEDPKIPGAVHTYMGYQLMLSVALVANAKMHVGLDSFCNHLTNYWWQDGKDAPLRRVPAVILFGSTQASASGYKHNTNISLGLSCQPCFREDPAISTMSRGPCQNPPEQSYQHPKHACMAGISVATIITEVRKLWSKVTE